MRGQALGASTSALTVHTRSSTSRAHTAEPMQHRATSSQVQTRLRAIVHKRSPHPHATRCERGRREPVKRKRDGKNGVKLPHTRSRASEGTRAQHSAQGRGACNPRTSRGNRNRRYLDLWTRPPQRPGNRAPRAQCNITEQNLDTKHIPAERHAGTAGVTKQTFKSKTKFTSKSKQVRN